MEEFVLEKEQLPVRNARQPGTEAGVVTTTGLSLDIGLIHLPLEAVRRIGKLKVEVLLGVLVVGERGAELDGVGIGLVRLEDEQVRLADGPSAGVELLPEEVDLGLGIAGENLFAGDGQDAPVPQAGSDTVTLGIVSSSGQRESVSRTSRRMTSFGVKCSPGFSFTSSL